MRPSGWVTAPEIVGAVRLQQTDPSCHRPILPQRKAGGFCRQCGGTGGCHHQGCQHSRCRPVHHLALVHGFSSPVSAAGISRQLVLAPGCCPMNPLYRSRSLGSIWSCYHFVIIFVPEKPPIPWQNKKTGPPIGEVLSDSVRRKQLGYRPVSGFTLLPLLPVFPVLPGLLTLLDELLDEEELLSSFSGCEIAFFSGRSEAM